MSHLAELSRAFEALAANVANRTVCVHDGSRGASGFLWSEGQIVTAEETLAGEGEDQVQVTLPDGRMVSAEVAGRDPSTDVALLRAETGAVEPWTHATPSIGALALVVGRQASGPLAAFGMVGLAGTAWTSMAGGRIDARIGLSFGLGHQLEGGAAVAADCGLIGLAVADPRRRALVIPAATVARSVAVLHEKGHVSRGFLGLRLQPLRGGNGGLVVAEISEGGPGAAAGLLVGDIITTWDAEPLRSMRGISARLGPDSVGRVLRLGVVRGGSTIEVEVTVGDRTQERQRS